MPQEDVQQGIRDVVPVGVVRLAEGGKQVDALAGGPPVEGVKTGRARRALRLIRGRFDQLQDLRAGLADPGCIIKQSNHLDFSKLSGV